MDVGLTQIARRQASWLKHCHRCGTRVRWRTMYCRHCGEYSLNQSFVVLVIILLLAVVVLALADLRFI